MKRRIMAGFMVVVLTATMIGGATMAWFGAKTDAPAAQFTAGTVLIEAGRECTFDGKVENVNPGDCYCLGWWVHNTGSKAIELRVTDIYAIWEWDWDWLEENWEALCFSDVIGEGEDFEDFDAFKAAMEGNEPVMGEEGNPAFVTSCPDSDWVLYPVFDNGTVVGYELYYLGGPVDAEAIVQIYLCVVFDGLKMGNIYQGATLTLGGRVQAVQASNDAPSQVWEEAWDEVNEDAYEFYHPYFDDFDFDKCICVCDPIADPGDVCECSGATAWGGDYEGGGAAWWYYYWEAGNTTQTIWANEDENIGTVTVSVIDQVTGNVTITMALIGGWALDANKTETVKIQGYNEWDLPSFRPAPGPFTTYKGEELVVHVEPYPYYAIHLDVVLCTCP